LPFMAGLVEASKPASFGPSARAAPGCLVTESGARGARGVYRAKGTVGRWPRVTISERARANLTEKMVVIGNASMASHVTSELAARMGKEVKALATSPPEGVKYVETDADQLTEIHAEMSGPTGTPYEGGTFRLKLVLGSDFPSAPPRGFFLTKIFHPNIAANGDICVNTLKRDWSSDVTLSHVLQVIRCLLIVPFPESSLNDEAGKLFMTSYDEYAARARLYTDLHAARRGAASPGPTLTEKNGDEAGEANAEANLAAKRKVEKEKKKQKENKKKGLKRL